MFNTFPTNQTIFYTSLIYGRVSSDSLVSKSTAWLALAQYKLVFSTVLQISFLLSFITYSISNDIGLSLHFS